MTVIDWHGACIIRGVGRTITGEAVLNRGVVVMVRVILVLREAVVKAACFVPVFFNIEFVMALIAVTIRLFN